MTNEIENRTGGRRIVHSHWELRNCDAALSNRSTDLFVFRNALVVIVAFEKCKRFM